MMLSVARTPDGQNADALSFDLRNAGTNLPAIPIPAINARMSATVVLDRSSMAAAKAHPAKTQAMMSEILLPASIP